MEGREQSVLSQVVRAGAITIFKNRLFNFGTISSDGVETPHIEGAKKRAYYFLPFLYVQRNMRVGKRLQISPIVL